MKEIKKRKLLPMIPLALAAFGIWSCEPQPDDAKLFDQFVVSTNYDTTANFDSYLTYAIPTDTIGLISNLASDDTIVTGTSYARPVLTAINTNLEARGYQRVERDEDPDLAVNAYVVKNLNLFQQVNGYYGYPGYYYPGYYGYYGYYYNYPYVSTYLYNTGVLVVEIVDLKNKTPDNKVKVIWNSYMGDVFSSIDRNKQTLEAIDQAFTQSPYVATSTGGI